MVEISRVLRPGGVFVASTFLKTFSPLGELLGDDAVRPLNQVQPGIQSNVSMPLSLSLSLSLCLLHFTARVYDTADILSSHIMLQYNIGDCHCMHVLNEFGTCKPPFQSAVVFFEKPPIPMVGGTGASRLDSINGSAELPKAPSKQIHHVFGQQAT